MNVSRIVQLGLAAGLLLTVAAACSEPPPPPPPPAPPVKTAEARVQLYKDCWGYFNDKAWDKFQNCYTEDATSEDVDSASGMQRGKAAIIAHDKEDAATFPDAKGELRYIFQHGPHLVGVAMYSGTNDGPMKGPDGKPMPATHKKFGLLLGHVVELDAMGAHAAKDAGYLDEGTLMNHLGISKSPARPVMKPTGAAPMVVMAKNDDKEAKNVAAVQASFDVLNKHDLPGVEATLADDYKTTDITRPADQNKKENSASLKELFSGFPDIKILPTTMFGAGDYVVVMGTFDGTNNGDLPSMGVKKTGKKVSMRFLEVFKVENGKIKDDWLFYNGAGFAAQLGLK